MPQHNPFAGIEYVVVNGILTRPGDIQGWTDKSERWYEQRDITCLRYEYFSGAVTRFLFQNDRVQDLREILAEIKRPMVYVGHSNGCELFSRLIKTGGHRFEAAHLFAAAVDPDFSDEGNGFNRALREGHLQKLYLYCSKNDKALRGGNFLTGWLKRFSLGYGNLGQVGPRNLDMNISHTVQIMWNNNYGHSDWWKPENIESSLQLTLRK
jgi:hypothetical protein